MRIIGVDTLICITLLVNHPLKTSAVLSIPFSRASIAGMGAMEEKGFDSVCVPIAGYGTECGGPG